MVSIDYFKTINGKRKKKKEYGGALSADAEKCLGGIADWKDIWLWQNILFIISSL